MKHIMTTSNKLLLGLLIAVLIFVTVMLSMGRIFGVRKSMNFNKEHREKAQHMPIPPAPPAPPMPPTRAE